MKLAKYPVPVMFTADLTGVGGAFKLLLPPPLAISV